MCIRDSINPFFITTSSVDLISHSRARSPDYSRFEPSNCNTMRQMASPMLSVPLVLDDCCTWRSHSCPTMTTRTNLTMKEAETPKPARQEGAPHLDLAAPCLASSFSPPVPHAVPPARSLPCLPLPLHGRRQASGRNEEQRTEGGVLSFSRLSLVGAQVQQQQSSREPPGSQRRGDAHGGESPRPPRTALPRQRERELP